VESGLNVEKVTAETISIKWCEHCTPVTPNARLDRSETAGGKDCHE